MKTQLTAEQRTECNEYAEKFGEVGTIEHEQAIFSFICAIKPPLAFDIAD